MLTKPRFSRFFLMDDNSGAGGPGGGDPDPNAKGDPNSKGGDAGDGSQDGGDAGGETPDEKKFSQADLDRIVAERLERAKRKRETEAQKEKEANEAAILKEKEDFKSLAEKHEAKISELETKLAEFETLKETHASYEAALTKYLEEARTGLPKHILALLDKLSVVDQLAYIAENAAELNKPKTKGMPETPDAAKGNDLTEAERKALQAEASSFYKSVF